MLAYGSVITLSRQYLAHYLKFSAFINLLILFKEWILSIQPIDDTDATKTDNKWRKHALFTGDPEYNVAMISNVVCIPEEKETGSAG